MINMPDLFEFSDYRNYLKTWVGYAKSNQTSNLTKLAESMGVHSSYLTHVLSGTKNLSFEQATELSEYLQHTTLEREYFFALLQIERAGSVKLKKYWSEKKLQLLNERSKVRSRVGVYHELAAEDRAIFYSSWIYVAVYVATAIDDGQSLEQIAERFELSREKAQEILDFLVQTGICTRSENKYQMGTSVVFLSNESPLVVKHHTNWRIKAMQKMDTRAADELFFTSPMSMSAKDITQVREILAKTIQNILEICKDSPAEQLVALNLDYFQVS